MHKDTAKQIMARAWDCMRLVNEMVEVALSNCDEDKLRVVRYAAGYTTAEMYERLIEPVLREYPDLLPEGIDYTPPKGPTFTELAAKMKQEPSLSEPRRGHEPQGGEKGTPSMHKDTAKQIIARASDFMRLVNEMVEVALSNCDEDELRVVRRAAAHALSELQDRLIDPILREYPDLLPEGIDYTPLKGPTFTELAVTLRPAPSGKKP